MPPRRDTNADVLAVAGMGTLEVVSRLQRSDLDDASLNLFILIVGCRSVCPDLVRRVVFEA